MAVGLMVVFVLIQLALGLLFLLWLWVVRIRSIRQVTSDRREALLSLAVVSFTLGVATDFYYMLARGSPEGYAKVPVYLSFLLACTGLVLSLIGRGRGRVVAAIASLALAMSWIPFILP